jgi:hypothetical protein
VCGSAALSQRQKWYIPFLGKDAALIPRPENHLPRYRKHRASGQAIVTISGKDHYLGPHGTKASKLLYDRLIAEYLAAGRMAPAPDEPEEDTVTRILAAY